MIFKPVSYGDLERALSDLGIPAGSILYVTASLAGLVTMPQVAENTVRAVRALAGASGTMVIPSFSWDFCDRGHFDREHTPTHCGILAEAFRAAPGVRRTWSPPYHTVCASGPAASAITGIESRTSFGSDSVFQYLVDRRAWVLLIGCGFQDGAAHAHWLEETQGVPYRYYRPYTGTVTLNGRTRAATFHRYMRRAGIQLNARPLELALESAGAIRHATAGLTLCSAFSLADFARVLVPVFQDNPLIMVDEKN